MWIIGFGGRKREALHSLRKGHFSRAGRRRRQNNDITNGRIAANPGCAEDAHVASRHGRRPGSSAHLSLAELQHLGQSLPLRRREVLLRLELLLQLNRLVVGEAHLAALSLVQRSLEEGGPQQGLPFGGEGGE